MRKSANHSGLMVLQFNATATREEYQTQACVRRHYVCQLTRARKMCQKAVDGAAADHRRHLTLSSAWVGDAAEAAGTHRRHAGQTPAMHKPQPRVKPAHGTHHPNTSPTTLKGGPGQHIRSVTHGGGPNAPIHPLLSKKNHPGPHPPGGSLLATRAKLDKINGFWQTHPKIQCGALFFICLQIFKRTPALERGIGPRPNWKPAHSVFPPKSPNQNNGTPRGG